MCAKKNVVTVEEYFKRNTRIPNDILDPAFRRIARLNGPIRKKENGDDIGDEETKEIQNWLREVDEPLDTKEGKNKNTKPRDEQGSVCKVGSCGN
ncbi:MAG TPA: hypothetical protein VMW72_01880 [Sedimentisphaerales bacterium]|nr:hypothetical protein [Sedimentisphaerales bacterium]